MSKRLTINLIVSAYILLFAYTGLSKLFYSNTFIEEVKQSPILKVLPIWSIWLIPSIEIATITMLLKKSWRLRGLYLFCIQMVSFTIYLFTLNSYADYIPCSCGGVLSKLPPDIHIVLNIVLTLLSVLAIRLQKQINKNIIDHKVLAQNIPRVL